jgi:transposase-like protein
MQIAMIRCPSCASPLDRVVRLARLQVGEPEVFKCDTEWGYARFEFGMTEIPVRCPFCGEEQVFHRDQPLAMA